MPNSTSKPAAPALDLSALAPVDAEVPTTTRERKHKDNPFLAWLAESFEKKIGKAVTVPKANVGEVEYLIRAASNELGIGARVVKSEPKAGKVTITFAGQTRKNRKTKAEKAAEAAAEASATESPAEGSEAPTGDENAA